MLFVGPNDLASSMGYPATQHPNIPEVQEAIARVLAACKSAGKYAGMVRITPEIRACQDVDASASSSVRVRSKFRRGSSKGSI